MNYLCRVNSTILGCVYGTECSKSSKEVINTVSCKN